VLRDSIANCNIKEALPMRKTVIALSATAFALSSMVFVAGPASAATTKMGCMVGKQTYNAMEGKCIDAKPVKKAAKKAAKKAVKT
jgi:hypothetical protein